MSNVVAIGLDMDKVKYRQRSVQIRGSDWRYWSSSMHRNRLTPYKHRMGSMQICSCL